MEISKKQPTEKMISQGFSLTRDHLGKLDKICNFTGHNRSEVIRQLIEQGHKSLPKGKR